MQRIEEESMANQRASNPPDRLSDLYLETELEGPRPLTRNFVPFLRSPTALEYESNVNWNSQYTQPPITRNKLSDLHWNRNRAEGSTAPGWTHDQEETESYPEFETAPDTMPSHPHLQTSSSFPNQIPSPGNTPEGKENAKRWTFGGLFKRKEKPRSPTGPTQIQFEFEPPPAIGLLSPNTESSPESEPRQNFLRRLSKKKKKVGGDGSKAVEGFLKVPRHPATHRRSTPEIQSWETTKCPPNLVTGSTNYSSSGSLSISLEGSSSLSRGSRVTAKEAVKARAEARRESILVDSSSAEEGEDDLENNNAGSHSSLSLRANRRQRVSPATKLVQGTPIHRVSNSSPNIYGSGSTERLAGQKTSVPGSRWEARIVYTQEILPEAEPVFLRLPKRLSPRNQQDSNGNPQYITESIADDTQIITAGLRLPLQLSSSYPKSSEPIYANLRHQPRMQPRKIFTPPTHAQQSDFYNTEKESQRAQFGNISDAYRPASYFLDNYEENYQPDSNNFEYRNVARRIGNDYRQRHWSNDQVRSSGQTDSWSPQISDENFITYNQEPKMRRQLLASPLSMKNMYNPEVPAHLHNTPNKVSTVSKLGFPVQKIANQQERSGASEFWRRQEKSNSSRLRWSPPPNCLNSKQEKSLSLVGIRSADSSPLPVPKHAKIHSPPPPLPSHQNLHRILRSNESISSLSSFSAETPSPNIFNSKNNAKALSTKLPALNRSRRIKSSEFKISVPTPTPQGMTKSACERLNVKGYTPSPPPPLPSDHQSAVLQLQNDGSLTEPQTKVRKSPGKNLEDALNELEDMYKSLRLSDEDLLDRAERRDLPTPHQELRGKDLVPYTSPRYFRFASSLGSGSLESVATTSGSGSTDNSRRRVRAPPMRRSGVPDRVNDDMARRKYDPKESQKVTDPREVMGQSGSYLAFSPAFSPPVSPCPGPPVSPYSSRRNEPDLIVDDVAVRNIRHANAIRVIDEPQPLFGVPLGPITRAPPGDYLHATPVEKFRPLFRHVKNPDVVKDDQAYRNLRKDLNQDNNLSKNWTPRLFSPTRISNNGSNDSVFNYNIQPDASSAIGGTKKLRAVRSLSANISHIVNPPCASSALREEIGKWNSYTDLVSSHNHRSSRSLTPGASKNFREASWVEQANLDPYGLPEPLYRPPSPNSNIKKKFKLLKPKSPPNRQELPDANTPRRPWTDIILQSYKDEEPDTNLEEVIQNSQDDPRRNSPLSEEDNDVFVDALPTTPSVSPPTGDTDSVILTDDVFFRKGSELLHGQKDRRGSYVDPKSSSLLTSHSETKRRSWSETPKQFESFTTAHAAIVGAPKKMILNPLPTPRRVKQINLEGFTPTPIHEHRLQSEDELNELINALVKDADTCGGKDSAEASAIPKTLPKAPKEPVAHSRKKRPSKTLAEKESKWQAAIAELESPSPPVEGSIKPWKKSDSETSPMENFTESQTAPVKDLENSEDEKDFPREVRGEKEDDSLQVICHSAPRGSKKSSSEPPPEPRKNKGKETPEGYPRSILKKHPGEVHSRKPSQPNQIHTKEYAKIKNGVPSNCIPPWLRRNVLPNNLEASVLPVSPSSHRNSVQIGNCKISYTPATLNTQILTTSSMKRETYCCQSKIDSNTQISVKDQNGSSYVASPIEKVKDVLTSSPGMNGLRRLLMRENAVNSGKKSGEAALGRGVKKSPSVGNVPSYWSKISSNQPAFLRKFFEKVNPSTSSTPPKLEAKPVECALTEPDDEPILSMSVAQKASHFMKLEHSQRFSKWRNLDNKTSEQLEAKQITEPGCDAPIPTSTAEACLEMPKTSVTAFAFIPPERKIASRSQSILNDGIISGIDSPGLIVPTALNNEAANKLMSFTSNGISKSEPSKLSLKDRVYMFNRLTSSPSIVRVNNAITSIPTVQNNMISTKNLRNFNSSKPFRSSGSSSSLNYYHPPTMQDVDSSYDNLTGFPLFRNHSTNAFPSTASAQATSRISTEPKAIPVTSKKRIRQVSHSADNDLSEDGEVSSGGMEVAEIISRSYENSPMVQKKSWGTSKRVTGNLSRNYWQKYGALEDNISHWSTATDLPEINSFQSRGSHFAKVTSGSGQGNLRKTSTSNLLSLLTAMSSSDEQLQEPVIKQREAFAVNKH